MRRLLKSLTSLLFLAVAIPCLAQRPDPAPTPEGQQLKPGILPSPPAEDQPQDQPDGPIHTLHVYMDLIQVPVLVLDGEQGRMKPVDPAKFLVSLDHGKPFRPKRVRQQGDDSITLGILLDTGTEPELMPQIGAAISALAPGSLHPKDHIMVYAMDCGLIRTLDDAPADPVALQRAVESALARWNAHHTQKKDKRALDVCDNPVNLWDSMTIAIKRLAQSPGRRVLLVVTSGADGGSHVKPDDLRQYAQSTGVAVFGYSTHYFMGTHGSMASGSHPHTVGETSTGVPLDGSFSSLCQLTGGVVLPADTSYVNRQLPRFVTTLRERYIVEFSRPRSIDPGIHGILITIPKVDAAAFIRPAGVTIVGPDHSLDDDPNTIKRDASDAPELGKPKAKKP